MIASNAPFLIWIAFIFIDFKRIINTKVTNANWNLNLFYYGLKLTQGKKYKDGIEVNIESVIGPIMNLINDPVPSVRFI